MFGFLNFRKFLETATATYTGNKLDTGGPFIPHNADENNDDGGDDWEKYKGEITKWVASKSKEIVEPVIKLFIQHLSQVKPELQIKPWFKQKVKQSELPEKSDYMETIKVSMVWKLDFEPVKNPNVEKTYVKDLSNSDIWSPSQSSHIKDSIYLTLETMIKQSSLRTLLKNVDLNKALNSGLLEYIIQCVTSDRKVNDRELNDFIIHTAMDKSIPEKALAAAKNIKRLNTNGHVIKLVPVDNNPIYGNNGPNWRAGLQTINLNHNCQIAVERIYGVIKS